MRASAWTRTAIAALALAVAAAPGRARADDNDLVLSRLGGINTAGDDVVPNNQLYRSLVSELGVVLAPKFLSPSDTMGYSGFQFSAELAHNSIHNGASYWCATEETAGCGAGQEKSGGWLDTVSVFARKGMWLPLPSFEVGAGALHLVGSRMWAGQAYAKWALHEGFHDWPIPSVAARGAVSRVFGSEQIDLTVASLDLSVSKSFGVQGTINLAPYAGWNMLWIVPRSEVIDKTPQIDAYQTTQDFRMNFVFPEQDNITRQRFFGGVKVRYYVFALALEVNVALAGSSVDDRMGNTTCDNAPPDQQGDCDAKDKSGSQQTYAASVSMDF